jgi:lysophospholipase L1-like esterase
MKKVQLFLLLLTLVSQGFSQTIRIKEPVRFLALGDSYTIGQSVSVDERWPEQFIAELVRLGYDVDELKIIAQTGWRTDNLQNAINQQMPLSGYNLVSLLIGVNNQYQGGSIQVYSQQFEALLQQAISLTGYNAARVFVLSIPDYAYTPFGNGNPEISAEIDAFNAVNRLITEANNVKYIDITPISRNGLEQPELVAGDGLHPSGLMYGLWVQEIVKHIEKEVGIQDVGSNQEVFLVLDPYHRQIKLVPPPGTQIEMVALYNLSGQLIFSLKPSGSPIPVSSLATGLYFATITTTEGLKRYKILIP